MPRACCCRTFSLSAILTCRIMSLGGVRGAAWNRIPIQPLNEEVVLTIKHEFQSLSRNVASAFPVECVAEFHVVGRKRFCDGVVRCACLEKIASHLLTGTYFSECAVFCLIKVHGEGFTIGR